MDTVTATLIVGLSTVLASGVASSIVTYKLNRSKEQTVFLREKAEQLYLAADEFGKAFGSQMITYFPLLEGRIDYNQMLDMQISDGATPKNFGPATMEMLVEIYFPSVRPALQNVWKKREAYNKVTAVIKSVWKEFGTLAHENLLPTYKAASLEMDAAIENLKKEIVLAARAHAGVEQQVMRVE